jgi:hypothetical protein
LADIPPPAVIPREARDLRSRVCFELIWGEKRDFFVEIAEFVSVFSWLGD